MTKKNVHLKTGPDGDVLCGAHQPKHTTEDPTAATCPLCGVIYDGRSLLDAIVHRAASTVTAKLAEVQRDPATRVLTRFVHEVLQADRSARAGEANPRQAR